MAQFLAPIINDQQEDASGNPLSGGKIEVYLAGTSTPATTYNDKDGLPAHANTWPIVLNTLGVNTQGPVWLVGGQAYKFIIKDSAGVLQRTIDNVSGINDNAVAASEQWVLFQGTPTFVSTTSFTVAGDQTQVFQVGRRLKTTNTGGTIYSTITASVYGAPNTTVTVVNDSGVLDSGLSAVSYGLISTLDTSLPSGRLLRVLVYSRVAGVQNVSINGGAPSTTGATTYTRNAALMFAIVEAIGGGGGGGGANNPTAGLVGIGAPGSSGSYGKSYFSSATIGASQAVSVGTLGAGGSGSLGGSGATTSFGALLSCPGGPGGAVLNNQTPPIVFAGTSAAGATGANLVSSPSAAGLFTTAISTTVSSLWGGAGGGNFFGPGSPQVGGNANGTNATAPGGGGSGVALVNGGGTATGGSGAAGLLIVWEYA